MDVTRKEPEYVLWGLEKKKERKKLKKDRDSVAAVYVSALCVCIQTKLTNVNEVTL
jgi:hypothetical protein